ncbi:MAG: hypothetical protein KDE51_15440 [Anaerolineales bacterium]|nr:hypothetical protein [Anaerolineales bacterium]
MTTNPEVVEAQTLPDTALASGNNCRYGTAFTGATGLLDDLRVGSSVNFTVDFTDFGPAIDYIPTIRVKQNQDVNGNRLPSYRVSPSLSNAGLGAFLDSYPGRLWLVGNEVDRVQYQDDIMPDIYAQAYHDIYHYIKDRDPTAQVAISGLVRISPGRLQYLDLVWSAYLAKFGTTIPVDVWNMHAYNLAEIQADGSDSGAAVALGTDPRLALIWGPSLIPPGSSASYINQVCNQEKVVCTKDEDNISEFIDQVVQMRQWMKSHGQQNKPLIISEFSLLAPYNPEGAGCYIADEFGNCFDPPRVNNFMTQSLNYLETAVDPSLGYPADGNRLVQQWSWYPTLVSNDDAVGSSSKLVNNNAASLTLMGETYRNFASVPSNLIARVMSEPPQADLLATAPATATVAAVFRNNGTVPTNGITTISFRDVNGVTFHTATIDPGMRGCTLYPETISAEWTNLPAGTHKYNVYINNVYADSGFVLVDPPYQSILPVVTR